MKLFQEISPKDWKENVFDRIGNDWMLISAGREDALNTMTASWGGVGVLWGKDVSFVFVRPSRYTFEFIESEDCYSLCFFSNEKKDVLQYCGTHSGRDGDKIKEMDLHTNFDEGTPYFEEADLVLICQKMYWQDMDAENFLDEEIHRFYTDGDYHRVYVGAITKVLQSSSE